MNKSQGAHLMEYTGHKLILYRRCTHKSKNGNDRGPTAHSVFSLVFRKQMSECAYVYTEGSGKMRRKMVAGTASPTESGVWETWTCEPY
jgi:hypothetical protein